MNSLILRLTKLNNGTVIVTITAINVTDIKVNTNPGILEELVSVRFFLLII